jgi:Na+/H+ antiporter NhaC
VTIATVDRAMGRPPTVASDHAALALDTHGVNSRRAALTRFVMMVVHRSRATLAVVLVAIIYIQRTEQNMGIDMERWTYERVAIGALIVASKVRTSCVLCVVLYIISVPGVF